MIVCTLELLRASDGEVEHLGTIEISNQIARSLLNPKRGDYIYRLFKKRNSKFVLGNVEDFPRHSYHPWNLVREILNDAAIKNGGRI